MLHNKLEEVLDPMAFMDSQLKKIYNKSETYFSNETEHLKKYQWKEESNELRLIIKWASLRQDE